MSLRKERLMPRCHDQQGQPKVFMIDGKPYVELQRRMMRRVVARELEWFEEHCRQSFQQMGLAQAVQ